MGAPLKKSGSSKLPEPAINVTPLVDVVLVLLIIFMVITPAIADGEHIELPEIMQPDKKRKDLNPIEVTIAMNGTVVVDKEPIKEADLPKVLSEKHAASPESRLLLKADEKLPYSKLRETFARVQHIGFKGVSLKVMQRKPAGAS